MKGFIYTILGVIIIAVIIIVLLGRDGTTPTENNPTGAGNDIIETDTPSATSTDETATSTDSRSKRGSPEEAAEQTNEDTAIEADVVIELTGENFAFSQEEITVQRGERVRIEFTSTDGFHDWVADTFDAATDRVQEGETTSVEFVADEVGEFEYYCSVGSHRQLGMVGTLIVTE